MKQTYLDEFSCHMKIGQMVVPVLLNKCKELLQRYIAEDKKSGSLPMARSKLAEVTFVLKQLATMELHPDAYAEKPTSPLFSGKKRHLLKLFPLLCDCITTKENEVKELLKEVFHEAGKEIGLE